MKATAELKMLPVSVLKPAAYNPRKKLKPGDIAIVCGFWQGASAGRTLFLFCS